MASCTYNCIMSVINIGNSIIGVSILAMPYCFSKCGILLSIVLIIISGLLTKLACSLLLKSAVMARRRSFEFLAFHSFGSYGKFIVEMSVIGFLIGVCIAFFVVIGDLGPPLAVEFLNIEKATNLRTNVLILVGLCVALPLGMLRKIDSLTSLSALSIAFYVCLILKIFAEAVPNLAENEWWYAVNWWKSEGILPSLPIFSMALSCQTQLFEFFDTSNEPSLKRMQSVIDGAVCLCSVVYVMVGTFGYIAFYDKHITGNILVLLTPSVITEFIKLGFILTIAVSFPLCLFPCRSSLHSLLFKQGFVHHEINVNAIPDHRFRILTVSLIIVTIGIAIMLPNIEFVLGIIGSTIGTLICLILPAIIFINDSNKMTSERRKAQILFGIGTFILIACTFSTLQENSNRPETVPDQIPDIKKMTPVPLLIMSSTASIVVPSPKVILKETVKVEEKVEISPEIKILNDQKRLEPPVPQEPEVKVEQNVDLDPQALQKEDKELLKDGSHLTVNSGGPSKKDDGLDKQEKLLKQLEEHHKEQKLILEEQRKVLEELKHHQESHELKEVEKKNEVVSSSTARQDNIKLEGAIDQKQSVKINPIEKNVQFDKNKKQESPTEKKVESLAPVLNNSSLNFIPKIKVVNALENQQKNEISQKLKDNVSPKKQNVLVNEAFNKTSLNVKHDIKNINLTVSSNSPEKESSILNIPNSVQKKVEKSDTPVIPDNEMHVKRRETLAKKVESETTISLPKNDINGNVHAESDKGGT